MYMYSNRYVRRRPSAVYEACAAEAETEAALENREKRGCKEYAYAMAYVKPQVYGDIYQDKEALLHGTVFPCLRLPYEGGDR